MLDLFSRASRRRHIMVTTKNLNDILHYRIVEQIRIFKKWLESIFKR